MTLDELRALCESVWEASEREAHIHPENDPMSFEQWWESTEYGRPLRHGTKVRFKKPKRGQTRRVGIIRSRPRLGSKRFYVVWPNAWAGWVVADEIEIAL